ncbi:uncharacterized protein Dana_GF14972 [Drosophila ananassae]|uniref:Uncharacterized protein n=1 Tax=Drosophila ananassae TaxID=7217 RepID=B3ML15_DROAN|nr:uncharacterized protein LOC6497787 [Drosophila ananassae]EDV30673.1 uncharacterized protein Dana_GF14972 [Drosophila ananassae]
MNSRRDLQPIDLTVEPSSSCTSSINNAQPVATSTPSRVSRNNSETSATMKVNPETKLMRVAQPLMLQEPEPQPRSSKTPNAGCRIPRTYAQIRGRGPIRAPQSSVKAAKTPRKPATPKTTRTPSKVPYSPRVAKPQPRGIVEDTVMEDAPISIQVGRKRRASPLPSPPQKVVKRLNGSGRSPPRRPRLEAFSINMRSPFTMMRNQEMRRLIIDDSDEDNKKVVRQNLRQRNAPKLEVAKLQEPLDKQPKVETNMISIMKVEPGRTYCDAGTNTTTADFPKTKAEPQWGCKLM